MARPQLIEALHQGLSRKLTLIAAPAGYGKTTLAAAWAHDLDQDVAWLSLDEADNDPPRFFSYLIATLQQLYGNIGEGVTQSLNSPRPPTLDKLAARLVTDISSMAPERFVMVLDDYHLIHAADVHKAVGLLLENLHHQMHLVLVTRKDPPLPLARMRVRGEIAELRAGQPQILDRRDSGVS